MTVKAIDVKEVRSTNELNIQLRRNCFSLLYISEGKMLCGINKESNIFYAPALVCISNKDMVSKLTMATNSKISIVYFDTEFLAKNMSMESMFNESFINIVDQHYHLQLAPFVEKRLSNKCFILDRPLSQRFTRIICKLKLQIIRQPDFYWLCRSRSCLMEILSIIERMLYDNSDTDYEKRFDYKYKEGWKDLESIMTYVNSNLNKHITLEELYKKFYINVQRIEKLFNKYMNVTYKQYIQNQRFALAKHSLRFTTLSLREIAGLTGYTSEQSFSKFFKKMSGTSPMAFRKNQLDIRRAEETS